MDQFELSDFVSCKYQDLPQYLDCSGIGVDHINSQHVSRPSYDCKGSFESGPGYVSYVWFIHLDYPCFDMFVYEVISWSEEWSPLTVVPFVHIHGTTYDGVRATRFSDTEPSNLSKMSFALSAADAALRARGWV